MTDTPRTKLLAAFLAGLLCTLGVQFIRDSLAATNARLDRIEQYLTTHPIPTFTMPQQQAAPQGHKESHKGELGQPQYWKV